MVHLNGHDHPLPAVFPDQLFFLNRMGRCFAQPGMCSPWQNADKSVLARCGCRMRRVLMIAVSVSYVRSVKQVAPSKPGGSVPCIGPFHLPLLLPRSPDAARLPLLP